MYKNLLLVTTIFLFNGCYNDQALLTSPNIHPVENAEDKISSKPQKGYNSYRNGRYYYDDYYYYNGYYYCGSRETRSQRRCDDQLVGSNGPLSYQNSYEGMRAREDDAL